jgi:hypothetical protein
VGGERMRESRRPSNKPFRKSVRFPVLNVMLQSLVKGKPSSLGYPAYRSRVGATDSVNGTWGRCVLPARG